MLMQNIQRNITKLLIRRILVAIATRTRGEGDPRSLLLVVSYCKFAPTTGPYFVFDPPSGAVAPARVSVPSGGAAAAAAEDTTSLRQFDSSLHDETTPSRGP